MKHVKINTRFGFSLIELSMVILVIGILVLGITQGSRIIGESRLKSARDLTQNSPVDSIGGVALWLEASDASMLKTSAVASEPTTSYGNIVDGNPVSAWLDINPQNNNKFNMTTTADSSRPLFVQSGINNIPALFFDGSNDFLQTSAPVIGADDDNYTIVAVWRADSVSANQVVVGQGSSTSSTVGAIYVDNSANMGFLGNANNYTPTTAAAKTPYITIVRVDNQLANNISVFKNSNAALNGVSSGGGAALAIASGIVKIGMSPYDSSSPFSGLISEVIIFNHALKQSEIESINDYLSKKYSIKLS
jgi:prepilin-type N-terminal cleavage/methylation domain-containing protein